MLGWVRGGGGGGYKGLKKLEGPGEMCWSPRAIYRTFRMVF